MSPHLHVQTEANRWKTSTRRCPKRSWRIRRFCSTAFFRRKTMIEEYDLDSEVCCTINNSHWMGGTTIKNTHKHQQFSQKSLQLGVILSLEIWMRGFFFSFITSMDVLLLPQNRRHHTSVITMTTYSICRRWRKLTWCLWAGSISRTNVVSRLTQMRLPLPHHQSQRIPINERRVFIFSFTLRAFRGNIFSCPCFSVGLVLLRRMSLFVLPLCSRCLVDWNCWQVFCATVDVNVAPNEKQNSSRGEKNVGNGYS